MMCQSVTVVAPVNISMYHNGLKTSMCVWTHTGLSAILFQLINYSLECGATCDSSDILTWKHRCAIWQWHISLDTQSPSTKWYSWYLLCCCRSLNRHCADRSADSVMRTVGMITCPWSRSSAWSHRTFLWFLPTAASLQGTLSSRLHEGQGLQR